ncbi:hypothetical protein HDU98_011849 [Podochytrium sp. JEL0797]|nr:hypothetical protein HDU98_011849 [Podochytrium sp. JEL0797]
MATTRPSHTKRVTFAGFADWAATFSSDDYDRSICHVEPLTGRDIAMLRLFRLSLPTNHAKPRLHFPQSPRCSLSLRESPPLVAAAPTAAPTRRDANPCEPNENDWITAIAEQARENYSLKSRAPCFDAGLVESVWDRVDLCCSQLLKCI